MADEADERELELSFIPPEEREAVRNYETEAESELAAGYLRANGIPAEVASLMMPGMAFGLALWVRRDDAAEARRLLDEADAAARGPRPVEE